MGKKNLSGVAIHKNQIDYLLVHSHDSMEDTHNIPSHISVNVVGVIQSELKLILFQNVLQIKVPLLFEQACAQPRPLLLNRTVAKLWLLFRGFPSVR